MVVGWYLLSQSLIPLSSDHSGEKGILSMCLLWPHHRGVNVQYIQVSELKTHLLHEKSFTWKLMTSSAMSINSLTPGTCGSNVNCIIFEPIIQNISLSSCNEIAFGWVTPNLINEKSTLVQVMAWYRQATSYYLSQYCPRSMSPYGVTNYKDMSMAWQYSRLSFSFATFNL